MDLNDAERYAVAALFTLALHSTHVETGVDKNGNSLSESDIAWGWESTISSAAARSSNPVSAVAAACCMLLSVSCSPANASLLLQHIYGSDTLSPFLTHWQSACN